VSMTRRTVLVVTLAAVVAAMIAATTGTASAQSCFGRSASAAPGPQPIPGRSLGEAASSLARSGATGEFAPVGVRVLQQARQEACPPESSGP